MMRLNHRDNWEYQLHNKLLLFTRKLCGRCDHQDNYGERTATIYHRGRQSRSVFDDKYRAVEMPRLNNVNHTDCWPRKMNNNVNHTDCWLRKMNNKVNHTDCWLRKMYNKVNHTDCWLRKMNNNVNHTDCWLRKMYNKVNYTDCWLHKVYNKVNHTDCWLHKMYNKVNHIYYWLCRMYKLLCCFIFSSPEHEVLSELLWSFNVQRPSSVRACVRLSVRQQFL